MKIDMGTQIANRLGNSAAGEAFRKGLVEKHDRAEKTEKQKAKGLSPATEGCLDTTHVDPGKAVTRKAMKNVLAKIHAVEGTKNFSGGDSTIQQPAPVTPGNELIETIAPQGVPVFTSTPARRMSEASVGEQIIRCKAASCRHWDDGTCSQVQIEIGAALKCVTYESL